MDIMEREARSRLMGCIRGKDTKPEIRVRRIAHRLGFRFRLHRKDLPGSPDLVFPSRRKVVFVHGCFWHRHEGCRFTYQMTFMTMMADTQPYFSFARNRRLLMPKSDAALKWLTAGDLRLTASESNALNYMI